MKIKILTFFIALAFMYASCGKKDEQLTTEQDLQQNQQQTTQQPTQQTEKKETVTTDEKKANETGEVDNKKQEIDFSQIWPKRCAKCHGKDGKGKLEGVPNLTRTETKSKSLKELISTITNGRQAETEDGEDMPSFKKKLTPEEIEAAAKYVKGLQ